MFYDFDAALITLPQPFYFDPKYVNAICLPNQFDKIDDSWNEKSFKISGFGEINSESDYPNKLQFALNGKEKSVQNAENY